MEKCPEGTSFAPPPILYLGLGPSLGGLSGSRDGLQGCFQTRAGVLQGKTRFHAHSSPSAPKPTL